MKVLNFGSLNLDYIYNVDHFVVSGETLSSSSLNTFCGGKGLNQSIALAKAGAEVWHAGAVGNTNGEILIDALKKSSVHIEFVKKKNTPTGHAIIQNNKQGDNCILLFGGANQEIMQEDIMQTLQFFNKGDYLILQNEINCLNEIICDAKRIGMTIFLNPSPMNNKVISCNLEKVDYFILNEIEAEQLCGEKDSFDDYLYSLNRLYPCAKFMLTIGSKGSKYYDGNKIINQSAFKTNVVDTTAAGDTFLGFFIGSIVKGIEVEEAMKIASMASSIACSRLGASPSIPEYKEVREYLNQV